MITVHKLQQVISESLALPPTPPTPRDSYLSWLTQASNTKLIKAIVGFRRSGKSYLLKMLAAQLAIQGIPTTNIFYLNFEHDFLVETKTVQQLRQVWELYLREIANLQHPMYIIWDEIQLVKNWEKLVRTLYEQGQYNIYLSGSNSELLSGEFSSSLSGRCLTQEIMPFRFVEYTAHQHINSSYYTHKKELDQAFVTYLRRGGIAEQFGLADTLANNYKDGLIQKIILDDIVKRYQIDKINVLQEAFQFVCGNLTSTLSLRNIIGRLENNGVAVSSMTLDNYLYYWRTAYALSRLTKFDYRLSRVFERTAKFYVIDNLLIPGSEENDEKRLENLVYNELVFRYGRDALFFGQDANGYEVDFVVKKSDQYLFFQTCLILTDDNAAREFGNLQLMSKHIQGKGIVLYLDDQRTSVKGGTAQSVISWLLKWGGN